MWSSRKSRVKRLSTAIRGQRQRAGGAIRCGARGFTLVELMVGIAVSLIGTLAMLAAFIAFENQKRTTTSGNDARLNGNYAVYELERRVRSAGFGVMQGMRYGVWGCALNAYSGATQRLPASAPFPLPFAAWPAQVRVLPVLVRDGGSGPDLIGIVAGDPAVRTFKAAAKAAGLNLSMPESLGIAGNDYVLKPTPSGDCALGKIANAPADPATDPFVLSAPDTPPAGLSDGYLFDLGPQPLLSLYGIDAATQTLVSYDLLQRGDSTPVQIADGIVMLKARYAIDSKASCLSPTSLIDSGSPPNVIDADPWVSPSDKGWDLSALTADQTAACSAVARIKAVRIAVIAISEVPQRAGDYTAAKSGITLFPDLAPSLQFLYPTDPHYRYTVVDTTIPIRNTSTKLF